MFAARGSLDLMIGTGKMVRGVAARRSACRWIADDSRCESCCINACHTSPCPSRHLSASSSRMRWNTGCAARALMISRTPDFARSAVRPGTAAHVYRTASFSVRHWVVGWNRQAKSSPDAFSRTPLAATRKAFVAMRLVGRSEDTSCLIMMAWTVASHTCLRR